MKRLFTSHINQSASVAWPKLSAAMFCREWYWSRAFVHAAGWTFGRRPLATEVKNKCWAELQEVAEMLRPSQEQLEMARKMEQKLQVIGKRLGGTMTCYGSCSNGTFMQGSDVDLSWMVDEQKILTILGPKAPRVPLASPPPPPGPTKPIELRSRPPPPPRLPKPPPPPMPSIPPPPARTLPTLQPTDARGAMGIDKRVLHFKALRLFRLQAQRSGGLTGIAKIWAQNARVPVLKFWGTNDQVLCDVSVNNLEGLSNSLLVREFCEKEPILAPVLRLLKHWARCRRLGDRATGGFSTYTLVLLAVHALQTSGETTLDRQMVQQLCEEVQNRMNRSNSSIPSLDIWQAPASNLMLEMRAPELFKSVFDLCSQPEFKAGAKIEVGAKELPEDDVTNETLRVVCPLMQIDVQRSKVPEWKLMFEEMSRAAQILGNQFDVQLLFQKPGRKTAPPPPPPLPMFDSGGAVESTANLVGKGA